MVGLLLSAMIYGWYCLSFYKKNSKSKWIWTEIVFKNVCVNFKKFLWFKNYVDFIWISEVILEAVFYTVNAMYPHQDYFEELNPEMIFNMM